MIENVIFFKRGQVCCGSYYFSSSVNTYAIEIITCDLWFAMFECSKLLEYPSRVKPFLMTVSMACASDLLEMASMLAMWLTELPGANCCDRFTKKRQRIENELN